MGVYYAPSTMLICQRNLKKLRSWAQGFVHCRQLKYTEGMKLREAKKVRGYQDIGRAVSGAQVCLTAKPMSLTPALYSDNVQSAQDRAGTERPWYMGPLTLERSRRVVFERGLTSFQQGLEPTGQGYVVFLAEDRGEMENAPFFTPLFSSPHNCSAGWAARGTHFWNPFFLWDLQASRSDCGPRLEGACFQSDRVRRRTRAPRLRNQPVAAPALRTCARCLRGSWALRCVACGPVPAPGAWGGFQEPRCEVERPPGKGRACLGPSKVPGDPERARHDLSSFAFLTSPPPDCDSWGAGISERNCKKRYFPLQWVVSHVAFFPLSVAKAVFTLAFPFPVWDFAVSGLWLDS